MYFDGLCEIPKTDLNIIKQNPHCAAHFCFYKNVIDCKINNNPKINDTSKKNNSNSKSSNS